MSYGPVRNPYAPGAGRPPAALAARGPVLARASQIAKGFIYAPEHGVIALTVPEMAEFIARQSEA